MKGVFIITIYLCINLIVAFDYDPIEESLQSMNNDELVEEVDQDPYETANVFPRSPDKECLQKAVSALKSTSEKLQSQVDELQQLINSEPAESEPPATESEGCESETSETPPYTTSKEVPVPMEAYGYANETTKDEECGENGKLKTWDKQITVCKEILQNNNKNLIEMISDLYPEGHKRTIKIQTKYRKGKSSNGKRGGNAWTGWTNWSPCSVSCGAGKQIRYRKCTGANCNADIELDERQCFQPTCSSFHKMLNNLQSVFERP